MFATIKKWLMSDGEPYYARKVKTKTALEAQLEADARMIGEPVTSFIASLAREPRRYKVERVLTLDEFPGYTCYGWMNHGAGTWKMTDTKTKLVVGAYIHERGKIYNVYGLPFDLNHWELKALYEAFHSRYYKAQQRKERIRADALQRAWKLKNEREQVDRLLYAEMFKEG